LDEIRQSNLFLIPLGRTSADTGGHWFRYHHLFAELLQILLERDHPDEIGSLHLKAAAWFEGAGHAGEAVDHALRSGDIDQAKALILKHWSPTLYKGEVTTVLRWLDALPEEMKGDDPFVALAHCWVLWLIGQSLAMEPHLERANETYERLVAGGALRGEEERLVAADLAMIRSGLAGSRGEHAQSVAQAEEALRVAPPENLHSAGIAWTMLGTARAGAGDYDGAIEAQGHGIELAHAGGNLVGAYLTIFKRAMYMMLQGGLNEARATCRSAIERAGRDGHGDFPAIGGLHIAMSRIELERNCLDQAEVHLNDGLRLVRHIGFNEVRRYGRYIRAHLAAARGDLEEAVAICKDTERIVSALDDPYLTGELSREWTILYLNAGELEAAREKLRILEETYAATQHTGLLFERDWMTARLLCTEGRYDEALAGLDEAISRARATNSMGELIRPLALQAVALEARGECTPARSALREAVALGAPGGYIWRWLNDGPEIGPLLRELRDQRETPQGWRPYLEAVLDACRSAFGDMALQPADERLNPLTERELKIMRLICDGYSNPEIAGELVVTVNTVKKHTSNIYSKLGVRSRTQAVARVRELNLLGK
jgi:LuxR family maltose regulon positive regulatory protein